MGDSPGMINNNPTRLIEETANSTVIIKKKHAVIDLLSLLDGENDSSPASTFTQQPMKPEISSGLIPVRELVQDDLKREILVMNRSQ